MPHLIGWAVRNFDSLPIDHDFHYLSCIFPKKLAQVLSKPGWILIYPEEELWFNYRKPRPLKKGAYYYAAKFNQPIISTFTEIQATSKRELFLILAMMILLVLVRKNICLIKRLMIISEKMYH